MRTFPRSPKKMLRKHCTSNVSPCPCCGSENQPALECVSAQSFVVLRSVIDGQLLKFGVLDKERLACQAVCGRAIQYSAIAMWTESTFNDGTSSLHWAKKSSTDGEGNELSIVGRIVKCQELVALPVSSWCFTWHGLKDAVRHDARIATPIRQAMWRVHIRMLLGKTYSRGEKLPHASIKMIRDYCTMAEKGLWNELPELPPELVFR